MAGYSNGCTMADYSNLSFFGDKYYIDCTEHVMMIMLV